jgi:FkbM family methyltransferase
MTVVDAGANIGTHTLYFANAVTSSGHVVAVEPQQVLYNVLCGNIALNGHRHVTTLNAALGSRPGSITAPHVDYQNSGNFGGVEFGAQHSGEEIEVRTLDSLSLRSCDLIKIDVEGMEKEVLEGAVQTLEKHRPFLYVENDRPQKSHELIAWLLAKNYRLYWHLPMLFNPQNYFGRSENVFGQILSVNMLCVPGAKVFNTGLRQITSSDDNWRDF